MDLEVQVWMCLGMIIGETWDAVDILRITETELGSLESIKASTGGKARAAMLDILVLLPHSAYIRPNSASL